jgi:hypothetical protein
MSKMNRLIMFFPNKEFTFAISENNLEDISPSKLLKKIQLT